MRRYTSLRTAVLASFLHAHTLLVQGQLWAAAVEALKQGKNHRMQVTLTNRGGARGPLEGLPGLEAFMPYSKLCTGVGGKQASKDFSKLVGTVLDVKVVAVSLERTAS